MPRPVDPFQEPKRATDPIDQSISQLITQILSAGDQQTRETLRDPLQELLAKKFDAEQQAREELVAELTKRLAEASIRVDERASRREQIIGEQVQRMLGLPLDDFQPLPDSGERQRFDDRHAPRDPIVPRRGPLHDLPPDSDHDFRGS